MFRDFPDSTFQAGYLEKVKKVKEIKQHLEFGCISQKQEVVCTHYYLQWSVPLSPDTRAKGKRPGWGGSQGLSRQKSVALPEIK